MIFVDAHVHIYDCFDVDFLFDSALNNFQAVAKHFKTAQQASFVLLMTEGVAEDWFQHVLNDTVPDKQGNRKISRTWNCCYIEKTGSLTVFRDGFPEINIDIVAGRQVITREKIEVLVLFCEKVIAHGLSLSDTIDAIEESGAIAVLPWGVGKWMGERGKIIKRFLVAQPDKRFFLGDNGGRPLFWPTPDLFRLAGKMGIAVLPGADPLPLPAEAARIGSYGFCMDGQVPHDVSPVMYLKDALLNREKNFTPFGRLLQGRLFFLNQLRLRLL